ncbi:hypothetical protein R5W23_001525 [Gemmata sp. JC673]|uniref:Rpn family recombination-promoting nuclease/putative transposase n=1 Tax=Gemmata algarum TaxID=2975278 RepID=A0ABU5EYQ7_9BACT|nr:hypothetical protein [Gemmata algarum]MDY3560296.1 hypothetical protein [Gemmata algarum]
MPANPFDKAARYVTKMDPLAFLAWAFGVPTSEITFGGWLDTRAVPLPHEPDQIGDTVARARNFGTEEAPWAIAIEFQIEPDPMMFGRLMIYLGHLWQSLKPDPERGSRFNIGAVVVNLTGTGRASREMRWPGTPLVTHLGVVERNLVTERAATLLAGIEAGHWSRALLPWLPLMTGGDDAVIIDRWKVLAEGEPDRRARGTYGGLALVFAAAAGRREVWEKALEGWNVIESPVVNEWIALGKAKGVAEGRAEGRAEQAVLMLLNVLAAKFGSTPAEVEAAVRSCADLVKLQVWTTQAATAATLAEFRTTTGL